MVAFTILKAIAKRLAKSNSPAVKKLLKRKIKIGNEKTTISGKSSVPDPASKLPLRKTELARAKKLGVAGKKEITLEREIRRRQGKPPVKLSAIVKKPR